MEKSEMYKAILKIQEYCEKQRSCDVCEFSCVDASGECICTLDGAPLEWGTGEIPCNILEEEE